MAVTILLAGLQYHVHSQNVIWIEADFNAPRLVKTGEDGTEFTVNVTKGMKAKRIAQDVAKELTLAAGSRYKVKQNGNKVVAKKTNKKEPALAIEMTNQKITGVSIMIGK